MTHHMNATPHEVARQEMIAVRAVFDALTADGQAGQEAEQGGNYYLEDPVESRNFREFADRLEKVALTAGRRVLVAGCGDGLETELLVNAGYEVTALDYSPNMVEVTRQRVTQAGGKVDAEVADVTRLDLSKYPAGYAGVLLLQVAQFIPVVDDDRLLDKAVTDLTSRTPDGLFFLSTTQYANPRFTRTWEIDGQEFGRTTYYARPATAIIDIIEKNSLSVVHHEHFDAGDTPPDDYKNDYIIASRQD